MYNLLIAVLFLGCTLIVPFVMLLGSFLMRNIDSEPNSVVGYRTARSMSSPEAWLYANRMCARLWKRIGWILLGASPAGMSVAIALLWSQGMMTDRGALIGGSVLIVITGIQVGVILWSIWRVEKELRVQFDKHGRPVLSGSRAVRTR